MTNATVNMKKGQKMKRIYQNWTVHNLIGHPLMQIFELFGMSKIATRVHDETLPSNAGIHRAAEGRPVE